MTLSTDRVFSNIYGPTATQETNSLMGGKRGKIVYLDQGNRLPPISKKQTITMAKKTNGGASKPKESVTIYADVIHFPNDKLQDYIDRLYLEYFAARAPPNTIFILPPDNVRQQMYSVIRSVTGGTGKGTAEEKRAIIENADKIGYKRYIFSKFGDNKREQLYKIGPKDDPASEYPNAEFKPIRRTNSANEVYYFSYRTPTEINISIHADLKEPVVLKFLGRCGHGVYIFTGDLPSGAPETYIPTYSKKQHTVIGGAAGKTHYSTQFKQFVNGFDDIDQAAHVFCMKRFAKDKSFASQFINADNVYSMFAMALTDIANGTSFNEAVANVSAADAHRAELEMQNISSSRLTDNISKRINGAINKLYAREDFDAVTHLETLYKNADKNIIRADLMTALYRNGVTSVNDLFKMTDRYMKGNAGSEMYSETLMSAFKQYPMTSVNGKAYPYIGHCTIEVMDGGMNDMGKFIESVQEKEKIEVSEEENIEVAHEEVVAEQKPKKSSKKKSIKSIAKEENAEDTFDDSMFY